MAIEQWTNTGTWDGAVSRKSITNVMRKYRRGDPVSNRFRFRDVSLMLFSPHSIDMYGMMSEEKPTRRVPFL
jgi:hypothetical protein